MKYSREAGRASWQSFNLRDTAFTKLCHCNFQRDLQKTALVKITDVHKSTKETFVHLAYVMDLYSMGRT